MISIEKQEGIAQQDAKVVTQLESIKKRKTINTTMIPKLQLSKHSQSLQVKQKIHQENNFIGHRILNQTSSLKQDHRFMRQIMVNKLNASKKQQTVPQQPYMKKSIVFSCKAADDQTPRKESGEEGQSYQLAESILKNTVHSVYEKTQRRELQSREMTRNHRMNTQMINTQLNRLKTVNTEYEKSHSRDVNGFTLTGAK